MATTGRVNGRSPRRASPGEDDELNNRLFFRLFQAGNIYARKAQAELNMSSAQGAILGALSRDRVNGIPLAELVEYLSVSRQNLDGVLKRLERLHYVERIEGPDNRRIRVVRLTPAGGKAWDDLFADSLEFYRQGTDGVPIEAKRALVETLGRINRALRAIDLGGGRTPPSRGAAKGGTKRSTAEGTTAGTRAAGKGTARAGATGTTKAGIAGTRAPEPVAQQSRKSRSR